MPNLVVTIKSFCVFFKTFCKLFAKTKVKRDNGSINEGLKILAIGLIIFMKNKDKYPFRFLENKYIFKSKKWKKNNVVIITISNNLIDNKILKSLVLCCIIFEYVKLHILSLGIIKSFKRFD